MRLALISLLMIPLVFGCGGGEKGANESSDSCAIDLTYIFPDGSTSRITDCVDSELSDVTFEFDPDEPPSIRTFALTLHSTREAQFECWLHIEQTGVCGTGYYNQGLSTGDTSFATWDCIDTPNEYEGEYNVSAGYIKLSGLDTSDKTGSLVGEDVPVTIGGEIAVESSGLTITGTFSVSRSISGNDSEEASCSDLDEPPGR